ncbi:hypothetical protein BU17DRAFT_96241 [Hysterangium stoloniferum]|nr:hypothetical protein BU17DRAFT_96241 [Hysterangium stoloniferum]
MLGDVISAWMCLDRDPRSSRKVPLLHLNTNRYLSQNHPCTGSISPPRKTVANIANGIALLYDAAIFGVTWEIAFVANLQASVSVILASRFFLDLHEQNSHANGTSQTKDEAPCSSFKAATRTFSNVIVEDLGDPEGNQFSGSQVTSSRIVSRRVLWQTTSDAENNDSSPAVNLEEFPWAAGRSEDAEPPTGTDTF